MKPLAFLFLSVALLKSESVKLENLKIGLKEYTGVSVSAQGRFVAVIRHDAGVSRIPMTDLPEDIQKRLGSIQEPKNEPVTRDVSLRDVPISDARFTSAFDQVCSKEGWNKNTSRISVVQSLNGMILATLDLSSDLVVVVGDAKERADEDVFWSDLQRTERFFEYTTVLGAKKKVRIYEIQSPITIQVFAKKLKAGETYTLPDGDRKVVCPECEGRAVPCDRCDNSGLIPSPKTVRYVW